MCQFTPPGLTIPTPLQVPGSWAIIVFGILGLPLIGGYLLRRMRRLKLVAGLFLSVAVLCLAAMGVLWVVIGPTHDDALFAWYNNAWASNPSDCHEILTTIYTNALQTSDNLLIQWGSGFLLAGALCIGVLFGLARVQKRDAQAVLWYNKALTFYSQKLLPEALAASEQALTIDPRVSAFWNEKGWILYHCKQPGETLVYFERALALDSKSFLAWTNKGRVLRNLKRYDEAAAACERALTIAPKLSPAWTNKGWILYDLQRPEEALSCHEQAVAFQPHFARGWNGKGYACAALGRYDEALTSIEQAVTIEPNRAIYWDSRGYVYLAMQHYDEALAALDHALELDASMAFAWSHKADALRGVGREAEAQEADENSQALRAVGSLSASQYED